jgi:4-hydroxy 2-oxovalerate aldolase
MTTTTPRVPASPVASSTQVRITDSTLRDGSHAVAHRFDTDRVQHISAALASARIPVVEVAHGDGLGGSSLTYGRSATDEIELITAARKELPDSLLAALILPGVGTVHRLREAVDAGVDIIRVATHCTEADVAPELLAAAKDLGRETVGFLMLAHRITPEQLATQAVIMQESGADCVYVVDSAGAMLPGQVADRVLALRTALRPDVQVGVHCHNNLGSAIPNTLAAVQAGAQQADGCLRGLGAGAGNAPTEVLVAACDRLGITTGIDTLGLLDSAEEEVANPLRGQLPALDRTSVLLGYAGLYSSFLLHARRAAARFGVPESELVLELGRRGFVGGQEDLIVDVALELAGQVHP